jgi:protein farnesyltransferase subunit beta
MKQRNGGFSVCQDGEIDIRGAYCSMTIISLLNLPLELPPDSPARVKGDETFLTNLEDWISRCQTYEGGIAGAPTNEAHGAYAFCALACLAIIDSPAKIVPKCVYPSVPGLVVCIYL